MDNLAYYLSSVIIIGLGATFTFDLWALFLKFAFKISPSNICLVGRWILYMPDGTFTHTNLLTVPAKSAECIVGWISHYMIGIAFTMVFIAFMGKTWLQFPTLIPALVFGFVTVLAPFFILQPSFGLGFAASKTPNPSQARFRSLMNHTAFGVGLYLFAWLVSSF